MTFIIECALWGLLYAVVFAVLSYLGLYLITSYADRADDGGEDNDDPSGNAAYSLLWVFVVLPVGCTVAFVVGALSKWFGW